MDSWHNSTLGGYCSRIRLQSCVMQINIDETWNSYFTDIQERAAFSRLSLQYVLSVLDI